MREIQTTLHNIQNDQIVEGITQKPLQNQQAHKSTADDHNAITRLNLAMVNTRNGAGHGFNNPVFIGQIGFRDFENALCGQVANIGKTAADNPVALFEIRNTSTYFGDITNAFVPRRCHRVHLIAEFGCNHIPRTYPTRATLNLHFVLAGVRHHLFKQFNTAIV